MKKIAVGFAAVMFSTMVLVPSEATTPKALVIIDSYFDSKVNAPNIKCVTTKNVPCTDVVVAKNASLSHDINHGNAMVEVAKKQSTSVPITLLIPTSPSKNSVSAVNVGHFIDALTWVNNNSTTVGAVSVSRFFGNPKSTCAPANVNAAPYGGIAKADATARSLIATLKSKNIPVFVSTGNAPKTKVDYPACIADTVSVTSPGNISDASTDVNGSLDNNAGVFNFNSPVLGPIPQTTSSVTVAVATQYIATGLFPGKVAKVNP
jgi:hypothetical protein